MRFNMDKTEIDGLPLPKYLLDLTAQGRWKTPSNPTHLRQITEFPNTDFEFLSIDQMFRVSKLDHLIDDSNIAQIYGHASSHRAGQPIIDPAILDVDKAIEIAVNLDEQAICLDYRSSSENPRVVFSTLDNNSCFRWKTIADDFKTFADYLNL